MYVWVSAYELVLQVNWLALWLTDTIYKYRSIAHTDRVIHSMNTHTHTYAGIYLHIHTIYIYIARKRVRENTHSFTHTHTHTPLISTHSLHRCKINAPLLRNWKSFTPTCNPPSHFLLSCIPSSNKHSCIITHSLPSAEQSECLCWKTCKQWTNQRLLLA